jgi:hypothetical protein
LKKKLDDYRKANPDQFSLSNDDLQRLTEEEMHTIMTALQAIPANQTADMLKNFIARKDVGRP